jgi:transcriptional regulator of aromatic amino acid metabolism
MQKNLGKSQKFKDLIYNPPQRWRVLSQALVNASRNCLLAVDQRGDIFLANKIAYEKFGAVLKSQIKDVIPRTGWNR